MSYTMIATRRVRCPKCRNPPIEYIELLVCMTTFEAGDCTRSREGYSEQGDIFGVDARCACGHRWRLRGVATMDSLTKR
jgi:hypothetical protein